MTNRNAPLSNNNDQSVDTTGLRPHTLAVHGGHGVEPNTGAVNVPIYLSSTYALKRPGVDRAGYDYARSGNPTREAVERHVAALEGGTHGFAFASGLAAESAIISLLDAGDHILLGDNVYGGTYRMVENVFKRHGIEASYADTADAATFAKHFRPNTRMVLMESPTNPVMKVSDLREVAKVTHEAGALLVVDNTFMSPYFQRPLELGADIVVHSATKYLSGHSDIVAGVVAVKDEQLAERIGYLQNAVGAILGVQDSYLLLRGMKTLALRMEAHERNAFQLAEWLQTRPWVKHVLYPGLSDHPGHALLKEQASGFGGMLSFEPTSEDLTERIVTNTRIFSLAVSLGGVESLIAVPAHMTHAAVPPDARAAMGISDSLIRISVGIEDVKDLQEDLARAAGA